jgi:hypothetical protein
MINVSLDTTEFKVVLFLIVFIVLYVFSRHRRRKKAVTAADVFKRTVLSELKGLYPVPRHLDKDVFDRFKTSIPAIQAAAAEFRKYVPGSSKKSFDAALDNYYRHCHEIRWEDCVAFKILPGERKPEDEGPREIFRQNVNALLSFTKQ